MKTLVIVPCYNEELSIKKTIESLNATVPAVNFIVIDDGSQDDTYQVCLDNDYPVIRLPFNVGLTIAFQTGMRYAYINSYDMALQFDGDGQHLPEYIDQMIALMQETSADIVIGSRFLNQKAPFNMRSLGSALIRFAIKLTTGKTITDPTSGMRLYNRKMIDCFANQMNYGPEPDTIAFLLNRNANVTEHPVKMQERKSGKSYLTGLKTAKYMLNMFLSILLIQWFRR